MGIKSTITYRLDLISAYCRRKIIYRHKEKLEAIRIKFERNLKKIADNLPQLVENREDGVFILGRKFEEMAGDPLSCAEDRASPPEPYFLFRIPQDKEILLQRQEIFWRLLNEIKFLSKAELRVLEARYNYPLLRSDFVLEGIRIGKLTRICLGYEGNGEFELIIISNSLPDLLKDCSILTEFREEP